MSWRSSAESSSSSNIFLGHGCFLGVVTLGMELAKNHRPVGGATVILTRDPNLQP